MVNGSAALNLPKEGFQEVEIAESPIKYCTVTLSDVISRGKRLEASVFDVEAKQARSVIENGKYPVRMVGGTDGLASSYVCGRFKRIWVEKSDLPIFQPSSITDVYPIPDGYISHKTQTDIEALRVHKGQVLMTCSGTIGKMSYVSKTLDNQVFSHDLLRINANNTEDAGYIYAYLKSKTGNKILLTNSYGAVITHIEPEHLATVPIPDAPWSIKKRINDLIVASYELRDASNALIDEATALLVKELHFPDIHDFDIGYYKKNASVDTFSIKLSDLGGRIDASYHVPIVDSIVDHMKKHAAEVTTVGNSKISKDIILPGRFKRVYVEEGYGVPFFGGRSIGELDPSDKKYLSFSQHDKKIKSELTIHEGMILITCSGTIGNVALVPSQWNNWAMTHDIIRLVPNKSIRGYLFIWLQTEYASALIKSYTYGSVVPHIEKEHLAMLPVPILKNAAIQKRINDLALEANEKRYQAYKLEQQALQIIDKEVIFADKNEMSAKKYSYDFSSYLAGKVAEDHVQYGKKE